MIEFQAPGKAVIWGEYAVLAGAPALVMALDRYARCRIDTDGDRWRIDAVGFDGRAMLTAEELLGTSCEELGVAAPVAAALRSLDISNPAAGAAVTLDTRAFYSDDRAPAKLGIGSSAAICTAACGAFARRHKLPLSYAQALAAHRWMQNPRGSGIDVAASFYGGVLRFQQGQATPARWPDTLHYRFIWTGQSASTSSHLDRFARYRAESDGEALAELVAASEALFGETSLTRLQAYVESLSRLDQAARLGIFSKAHRRLHELAIARQVVYKPCGAGGGDIGVAFSEDKNKLIAFSDAVTRLNFRPLSLEIAPDGIEPTR